MEKLKSLKIELEGSDALHLQYGLNLVIEELKKYTGGSDRILARRLEIILQKHEMITDSLELAGSDVLDMRHGLVHAMHMLDDRKTDDDKLIADRLEIIFDKVDMISE